MSLGTGLLGGKLVAKVGADVSVACFAVSLRQCALLCSLPLPTDIFGFLHMNFITIKKEWQAC